MVQDRLSTKQKQKIILFQFSRLVANISPLVQKQRIHLQCKRCKFPPWVGEIPWRWKWQHTPLFLLVQSHGQRSLVGSSPWGHKELDTTERLNMHASNILKISDLSQRGDRKKLLEEIPQKAILACLEEILFCP